MLFNLSEYSPEPLQMQLSKQIIALILSGDLRQNDRLLPVHQMARCQKISSSTVRRSYLQLEKIGLLNKLMPDHYSIAETAADEIKKYDAEADLTKNTASALNRYIQDSDTTTLSENYLKRELDKAREIQQRLFPRTLPHNPAICIKAYSESSRFIGGDLYDSFYLDRKKIGILIADACGSGLSAALLIAQLRSIVRSEIEHSTDPAVIINHVSQQIYETLPRDKFITLFFAVYEIETHRLIYVNAGHHPPIIHREGQSEELLAKTNPALGMVKNYHYKTTNKMLLTGDCLMLYTDGLTEAIDSKRQAYGEERLREILDNHSHADPQAIIDAIIEDLSAHTAGVGREDDRTVLVMKIIN